MYFYILIKFVTSAPRPQAFGRNAAPQADLRPRRQYDATPPAGEQPRRPGRCPAGSITRPRRLVYSAAGREAEIPGRDKGLPSLMKDLLSRNAETCNYTGIINVLYITNTTTTRRYC